MREQASENEFAILYRTNTQSRAIEEALRRMNIKYRVVGGVSFYQRKEIKDVISYLRYAVNPNDEQALRRIINYPKRGIGLGTIDKLVVAAAENGITLWDTITRGNSLIGGRGGSQVEAFATMFKSFRLAAEKKNAFEFATQVAKNSGILQDLHADKSIEGMSRYENVQELLNAIREFVDDPERDNKNIDAFLQDIALLTDEDRNERSDETVTLMTIHMAKGLEFNYVYIVGLEEDLFPSQMMLSSRADLEEERRLFYVAITRAKTKLFFSYALNRYRFNKLKTCEPSRFLDEIEPQFINSTQKFRPRENTSKSSNVYTKNFVKNVKKDFSTRQFTQINHTPSSDFQPSNPDLLQEGNRVEHPKFGFGTVIALDVSGSNKKAKVSFEKAGEKTLLLNFAKLRILN